MKKVSTVEELVEAVDSLHKFGTTGVQIVPQQGAVLLPRDDFMPSAKAQNFHLNLERKLDAADGELIVLGGKFSLYLELGQVARTDRAVVVPLELCNKTAELRQEAYIYVPQKYHHLGDPEKIGFVLEWANSNVTRREYSLNRVKVIENTLKVEETSCSEELSERLNLKVELGLKVTRTLKVQIGEVEYGTTIVGDCWNDLTAFAPHAVDYGIPFIFKGESKRTHMPVEICFYADRAEILEAVEYETETKTRSASGGLSYDEMATNGMGVDELPESHHYTVQDVVVKKLVMGEPRIVSHDEAMKYADKAIWAGSYIPIPKAYTRSWEMSSQEEADAFNKKASEEAKAALEKMKADLTAAFQNHGTAVTAGSSYKREIRI